MRLRTAGIVLAVVAAFCGIRSPRVAAQTTACGPADLTVLQPTLTIDAVGTVYRGATINVRTARPCSWSITVGGFVAIAWGPSTFTGSAAVPLKVGTNPSTTARSTIVDVQGQPVFISQQGRPLRGVAMDFDGDGRAELCSMHFAGGPEQYLWSCDDKRSPGSHFSFFLGLRTDKIVPADYNGDHIDDPAVYRPSTGEWFIMEAGQIRIVKYGRPGDIPTPGDYNGDGAAEPSVYRLYESPNSNNGAWHIPEIGRRDVGSRHFLPTPVPADYDGDGFTDLAFYYRGIPFGRWEIYSGSAPSATPILSFTWGLPGDIPVPADYDGDGRADAAVYRPSTGEWFVKDVMTARWGQPGDIPLPLDFEGLGRAAPAVLRQDYVDDIFGHFLVRRDDGSALTSTGSYLPMMRRVELVTATAGDWAPLDRRADFMFFRPADSSWHLLSEPSRYPSVTAFGLSTDQPVGAVLAECVQVGWCLHFGWQTPAAFRSGTWVTPPAEFSLIQAQSEGTPVWGMAGDIPLPGDYLGVSAAQLAVFRPSTATWYVRGAVPSLPGMNPTPWGQIGDVPVPADFDGDSRLDLAVWRPSDGTWSVLCSSGRAPLYQQWGIAGDIPLPADYDGDGRADFAVFRPSNNTWYVFFQFAYNHLHTIPPRGPWLDSTLVVPFGTAGDVPVPADYTGDGITDIAVWTPATGMWTVRNGPSVQWGQPGDIPVVVLNR